MSSTATLDDILEYLTKIGGMEVMEFDNNRAALDAKSLLLHNFEAEGVPEDRMPKVVVSETILRIFHPDYKKK